MNHLRIRATLAFVALLLTSCLTAPVFAQQQPEQGTASESGTAKARFLAAHGDFAEKARRFTPMIELSALHLPEGKVHKEPGEFELTHYKLEALIPIPMGRDTFLLAGAHFGARNYDFSGVSGAEDDVLYSAGLRVGAGHFINDDFVIQAYWQPSLYSDLDESLNSEDWKLWYGAALATYRCRDNLFLKVGVLLTDAQDTGAIPLAGVCWTFHPQWRLDILLPRHAEVSWSLSRPLNLQVGLESESEEFHVRTGTPQGTRETDVHVQDIRAYLGASYRFTDMLSTFAKVGSPVAGDYKWRDGGAKYDGTLELAFFAQMGLGLTF